MSIIYWEKKLSKVSKVYLKLHRYFVGIPVVRYKQIATTKKSET